MDKIFKTVMAIIIACSFCFGNAAWASEEELLAEIKALKEKLAEMDELKARVAELEKKIVKQEKCSLEDRATVREVKEAIIQYKPGEGIDIKPCGLEITAGATLVMMGTPNANNAGNNEASRFDASWSSDIFIQRAFDDWGLALIHLEPGQNDALESELSLYSNVNRDSNDTSSNVPVTELWYEHYLFNRQVAVTLGKMDPANYIDQNEYSHDETTQFLGRLFKQSPVIEWPDDNTLGARILIAPQALSFMSLEAAYFDANNDWENIFDGPFISTQLTLKPSKMFNFDQEQWDGNYRFYWWMNCRNHEKLMLSGETDISGEKYVNTGFGVSADQMVTDVFGVFGRFGWQRPELVLVSTNPNAAPCEMSWSSGMQMTGKYWNREDDVLAFGIGQVFPSKEYKDAGNGGAGEGHFETYYKWQLFKQIAISPDFQVIWNPRGVNHSYIGDDDVIFVYGVRGQIDL